MINEKIYLKNHYIIDSDAWIEINVPYTNDITLRNKSKAIIIVPGGAYSYVSNREADPVAVEFLKEDFTTITLHYSVKKEYPQPMLELAYTFDYLRKNSDKYYIDKNKISVIGFSAGGHLVSSYGYLYKKKEFLDIIKLEKENIKPNALVLSYPVITMGEYTHFETRDNISNNKPELLDLLSVEKNIDEEYPPTFIWTTKEDLCVPYQNSELMVSELIKHNVAHEYFLYPYLNHGLSVINSMLYSKEQLNDIHFQEVSVWFKKSVNFINKTLNEE